LPDFGAGTTTVRASGRFRRRRGTSLPTRSLEQFGRLRKASGVGA